MNQQHAPPRVLIVGGGPTGLTAAVELARRGIIADVIEKQESASQLSRAVGILPSSMEILAPSGVADAIRREAIPYQAAVFHKHAYLVSGGRIAIVAPLEPTRFRVVSNTPDALKTLPAPMNITTIRRQASFHISVRQVEHYRRGRVFLAGDAAHCHSPVGGRGMNLGIADAAELARRIADGDLDGYDTVRRAAGHETIALSERGRRIVTSPNPLIRHLAMTTLRTIAAIPPLRKRAITRLLTL